MKTTDLKTIHRFDPDDAKLYGINAAIILDYLKFWLDKGLKNNEYIDEGRVWTYNSISGFTELFPYMSIVEIVKALYKLRDNNIIIVKLIDDKSAWYSINDEKYVVPYSNKREYYMNSIEILNKL